MPPPLVPATACTSVQSTALGSALTRLAPSSPYERQTARARRILSGPRRFSITNLLGRSMQNGLFSIQCDFIIMKQKCANNPSTLVHALMVQRQLRGHGEMRRRRWAQQQQSRSQATNP